jgi:Tfp pilus assembly protein FimT
MRSRAGFSAIEVVSALVVIAVLGAFLLVAMQDSEGDLAADAATLKAHLRFAQSLAMSNMPSSWSVQIAANSYTLRENGSPAARSLPGESSSTHTFRGGVSATAGIGTLAFDDRGTPGAGNYTIVLNGVETIVVTGGTGFIP